MRVDMYTFRVSASPRPRIRHMCLSADLMTNTCCLATSTPSDFDFQVAGSKPPCSAFAVGLAYGLRTSILPRGYFDRGCDDVVERYGKAPAILRCVAHQKTLVVSPKSCFIWLQLCVSARELRKRFLYASTRALR